MSVRLQLFNATSPINLRDWRIRLSMLLAGLAMLGLLLVARLLSPDARGLGTHEQLGLPPCGFHLLLGWPCPSCGMTTAWSLFTRGQIGQACSVHFGAVLLAGADFVLGLWLVGSALIQRWIGGWPTNFAWAAGLAILFLAILITWIFKLLL